MHLPYHVILLLKQYNCMKLENHSMPSFYNCLLIGPAEVEWLLNHEMMLKFIRDLRASGVVMCTARLGPKALA